MAGFTLFPAETGVKLTLQRRAAMIARMRSRVSHMAICAAVALACNEGLQPTTAAPAIRGTVTYQGHLPDSLRDSTGLLLVVAFATFPGEGAADDQQHLASALNQLASDLRPRPAVRAVMRAPLLAFLAVVPGVAAAAQATAILYGSVTDSLGQPLRATVRVVGSPAMAVADSRGRYRLAVPAGRVIVRAGHIGFRSQVD